ncbi:MAG TPA: intradiol ring-cleavage dioxygenase [Chitinophagaceae bacterium]|nr:intradiol ring-cleavage dioxygenase [Chitinophagaceae bacterium]
MGLTKILLGKPGLLYVCLSLFCACQGQSGKENPTQPAREIGGPFENRDYMYMGMPSQIPSADSSSGLQENAPRIMVTGVVYRLNPRRPAPGTIIYYYHTNADGRYLHKPSVPVSMPPNGQGQTHGYIRGWVKTDSLGRYKIYTIRPGVYPTRDEPAHIHLTVKEPNDIPGYYIDDIMFDDDKLLTSAKRLAQPNRAGSGVVRLVSKDGWQVGERDIYLGMRIPGHPEEKTLNSLKGIQAGEEVQSFIPWHAWGPDKGKRTCPVCAYGWYHGILYLVKQEPDWADTRKWLMMLEEACIKRDTALTVYFVYGNPVGYTKEKRMQELSRIGRELGLKRIAVTFVPSFTDEESEINLNNFQPGDMNSFILFKRRKVIDRFENLQATEGNFQKIMNALDGSENEYFHLESPTYH